MIDREMQVIITELMLWDAWYYTKKVGNKDKPFVVVLDEAQNLSHKKNSPSAAILTEGRKFGWSAWFATQSLKILAEDEVVRLLQAACKLYFKPTDDEVIKMSKQLDPTDGSAWLSALKSLNKGQCIVVGERVKPNGTFGQTKPTITSIIPAGRKLFLRSADKTKVIKINTGFAFPPLPALRRFNARSMTAHEKRTSLVI